MATNNPSMGNSNNKIQSSLPPANIPSSVVESKERKAPISNPSMAPPSSSSSNSSGLSSSSSSSSSSLSSSSLPNSSALSTTSEAKRQVVSSQPEVPPPRRSSDVGVAGRVFYKLPPENVWMVKRAEQKAAAEAAAVLQHQQVITPDLNKQVYAALEIAQLQAQITWHMSALARLHEQVRVANVTVLMAIDKMQRSVPTSSPAPAKTSAPAPPRQQQSTSRAAPAGTSSSASSRPSIPSVAAPSRNRHTAASPEKVFFGGLCNRVTPAILRELLVDNHFIERLAPNFVWVARRDDSRGYGFAVFPHASIADAVVAKLDGVKLFGRSVKVAIATGRSKEPRPPPPEVDWDEAYEDFEESEPMSLAADIDPPVTAPFSPILSLSSSSSSSSSSSLSSSLPPPVNSGATPASSGRSHSVPISPISFGRTPAFVAHPPPSLTSTHVGK